MRKINAENLITITYATYAVAQRKPERFSYACRDWIPDHCDTSAAITNRPFPSSPGASVSKRG